MNGAGADERAGPRAWVTPERARVLALLVMTAAALWLCGALLRPFAPALAWAVALAVVAFPMHERVERRVRRPGLAAACSVAIVTLLIVGPTVFVLRSLAREVGRDVEIVRSEIESERWREAVARSPRAAAVLAWVEANVDVREEMKQVAEDLAPRLSSLVTGSAWGLAQLVVALFVLFYLFRDRCAALDALGSVAPMSEPEFRRIVVRARDTIRATVFGTLAVALAQGVLGGLMFWALGLPSPLFWGSVMALLAILPVLGASLVWGPAALALALGGSWGKATVLAVFGLVVISLVDNLLYPILVGKEIRLHTVPVFFAIVGGLAVFGASGIVLGPVVLALTAALLDLWRRRSTASAPAEDRTLEDSPVAIP